MPQVDADGNELAGIRMPELAVPVATYTGWNLFNEKSGPTDVRVEHAGLVHSAGAHEGRSRRERRSAPSIEERYRGRDQYLAEITKAANDLVTKGYLLKADVPRIVAQAGTRWDFATKTVTSTQEKQ